MLAAMYRIAAAVVRQEAEVVHVCSEKNLYTLCIAWLCTELYPKCAQFFVHDMKIPVHNQLMQSVHRNFIPKKNPQSEYYPIIFDVNTYWFVLFRFPFKIPVQITFRYVNNRQSILGVQPIA